MKKNAFLLIPFLFCGLSFSAFAQKLLSVPYGRGCNFMGVPIAEEEVYIFPPSNRAEAIVNEILQLIVLTSNFEIQAANVPNAMAHFIQGKRYILYNEEFMDGIYQKTGNHWAQIMILSHEIGHHLNNHTWSEDGNLKEMELEADQFAGGVLFRMGATLEQAQTAVSLLPENINSKSHPPISARLQAIAVGYLKVQEQERKGNQINTLPAEPSGSERQAINDRDEEVSFIYAVQHKIDMINADILPRIERKSIMGNQNEIEEIALRLELWISDFNWILIKGDEKSPKIIKAKELIREELNLIRGNIIPELRGLGGIMKGKQRFDALRHKLSISVEAIDIALSTL